MARKLFAKHILRKIFLEDWALKLLALVITFGLWFIVTGLSTPTTKRLNVPLVLSISSNAQVVNAPLQEVDIELSGDKRKIEQINRSELSAILDLADTPPGNKVVSLSPDNVFVSLPPGVKLIQITPSRIAVNLEAVEEKEMEVKAATTGIPAVGFEIYSSAVLPPRIRVRGPASVIRILDYVQTDPIDIGGRKEEFTARQVAVNSPDPKAAVLNTVVDVVFKIGERRIERAFTIPLSGDPNRTASFIIFGPKTALAKLRAEDLKIEIYLDGDGSETARVLLPKELEDVVEVRKLKLNP